MALLLVSVMGTEVFTQQPEVVIRVRGADSMARRIDLLSQEYMKIHPDVRVVVSGGSKEAAGLQELMEKHSEVAMAGRQARNDELDAARSKGVKLVERFVGYGGVVIVTHPTNAVAELTVEQVKNILTGRTSDWEAVGGSKGPITVVTVGEPHGGTVAFLESTFLRGRSITKSAKRVERFPGIMRMVAQTPGSVGYVRVRDALESAVAQEVRVKLLPIKQDDATPGVIPSRQSVAGDSYPIKRPFFLYVDEAASADVKEFVDFIVRNRWGPQSL
ncbi:MAG: substrate-binding domain-containing protein [Thermodesulfobacteriota bacterium]